MTGPRWHTRRDGTEVLSFPMRICAFTRLSGRASRWIDARDAAVLAPPGSRLAVARDDARTTLDDARAAHTLALDGVTVDDLQPNGLLTHAATDRRRSQRCAEK